MPLTYNFGDNGTISHQQNIGKAVLIVEAHELRRAPTGIHGKLRITLDNALLNSSYVNLEKDEDRVRLANSAHRQFTPNESKSLTAVDLQRYLTLFCDGLWKAHLANQEAEYVEGDAEPSLPSYILYPHVLEGGGTMLFAPPGQGKSYIGLLKAVSADAGVNLIWETFPKTTLYINLERSEASIKRRLSQVNRALGLNPTRSLLMLNRRGRRLADIAENVLSAKRRYNVEFMVVDSITRTGYGDLTENLAINSTIDILNGLCPSWLGIGHTPLHDQNRMYGGILWDAGADIMLMLKSHHPNPDTLGIRLEVTKANDIRPPEPMTLELKFDQDYGLTRVRKAKEWEFPDLHEGRKPDMAQSIIDYLLEIGEATATLIAKELGYDRSNVSNLLGHDSRFTRTKRDKSGVYYAVKSNWDSVV